MVIHALLNSVFISVMIHESYLGIVGSNGQAEDLGTIGLALLIS